MPAKATKEGKPSYAENACPLCKVTITSHGEFVADYLGGSDGVGLTRNEKTAKSLFYHIKSLVEVCCHHKVDQMTVDGIELLDSLIATLLSEALTDNGQVDLEGAWRSRSLIVQHFERLRDYVESHALFKPEVVDVTRKQWEKLQKGLA
jgi:hypothetical protein